MKRLFIDLTATLDDQAANRCKYSYSPRAPIPLALHLVQGISAFSVRYLWDREFWTDSEPLEFEAMSWTEEEMSEKAILENCAKACSEANEVVMLTAERFELPILFNRALVHRVPALAFTSKIRRHAAWRFHAGPLETISAGLAPVPSLSELCAALHIDWQPADGVLPSIASIGVARARASWVLDEYWQNGNDPAIVSARKKMLADWM